MDTTAHSPRTVRRRTTRRGEDVQARGLALLAAVGAALAGCEPTGTAIVDPVLTGAFAAVVTLAGARSKRWPLLVLPAGAVLVARDWVLAPALASAVAAVVGARQAQRSRLWGAATAGLAVQALLRAPDLGFHGASALAAAAVVTPVLVFGYRALRPSERRRVRRAALAVVVPAALVTIAYGALVASSYDDLSGGNDQARAGLRQTRRGETTAAKGSFAAAAASFTRADDRLGGWWTAPASVVPVLAQHARSISATTEQGARLAATARDVVEEADYEQLRTEGGRFDLARIAALEEPLRRTGSSVDEAGRAIGAARSRWLVPFVAAEVDDLVVDLRQAGAEADLAAEAVRVAPALLGADGPRRYLVVFVTPSELRGSGGFIGSYAEVQAVDGDLRLGRTGSSTELNPAEGNPIELTGVDDYVRRYGAYAAGQDFRDLTFSPHFPDDGEVISQVYPQVGGQPVDGVISVDPISLAALLRLTGPIESPGFGRRIGPRNAAQFLLRDNYSQFPDNETQTAALSELVRLTFDRLTTGELPGPRDVTEALGPATRAGRIRLWSPVPAEEALFARMGADGAFPEPRDDRDFLAVASQNSGNNKIDYDMRRSIEHRVSVDDAGRVEATTEVTVRNEVPLDAGLPDYVVGNSQGDPPGTNRMLLTVYSPLGLDEARIDGAPATVQSQSEAGYRAYTAELVVPPGGSVTLELRLSGARRPGAPYVLDLVGQPTVNADELVVTLTRGSGRPVTSPALPVIGRLRWRAGG